MIPRVFNVCDVALCILNILLSRPGFGQDGPIPLQPGGSDEIVILKHTVWFLRRRLVTAPECPLLERVDLDDFALHYLNFFPLQRRYITVADPCMVDDTVMYMY